MPTDYSTLAKKFGGVSATRDYSALAKKYGGVALSDALRPEASDLTSNPAREGTYSMQNRSGTQSKIPYSMVGRASKSGYVMQPEDRERYLRDAAFDPKKGEGVDLPKGVVVVGRNTAGEPILGPAGTDEPKGSAARRFLRSATDALVAPVVGTYHAFADPAQNAREARTSVPIIRNLDRAAQRLFVNPAVSEAKKAMEAFQKSGHWFSPYATDEEVNQQALAMGHGLAAILPGVGPAAAAMGEQVGTQIGTGDIAGAAGTGAGNALLYALPEGAGRVARSEWLTRSKPHSMITKLIRPMKGDLAFGKNPAQAILDEGITGNLEQMGDKVYARLHEVGKKIDQTARNSLAFVDLSSALKPIDNAMADAVSAGDRKLYIKLRNVKNELSNIYRVNPTTGRLEIYQPRPMGMTAIGAVKFKRIVGDRIRWTGDGLDGPVNQALGEVYGNIREKINNQVSGLKELNQKYSNLLGAAKAIERRLPVESRNANWSLSDITLGTHNLPLAAARHIARMPRVRSRTAKILYNLPRVVPPTPIVPVTPTVLAAPATAAAAAAEEDRRRRLAAQPQE